MEPSLQTKGLTRNPLGIIAIFISMIYGIACIVLTISIKYLKYDYERLPLIWFVIIFPLTTLGAFVYLVIKHHGKLYSPRDYRLDETFVKTLDSKAIEEKRKIEVLELEQAKEKPRVMTFEQKDEEGIDSSSEVDENTNLTDQQVNDISELLVDSYKNAEQWAIQELSLRYSVIFKPNINLSVSGLGQVKLDAMGDNDRVLYIAEIKYWKSNKSNSRLKLSIQEFLLQHNSLKHTLGQHREFVMIVALVFDSLKQVNKQELLNFILDLNRDCRVEFFDYNDLQNNYQ